MGAEAEARAGEGDSVFLWSSAAGCPEGSNFLNSWWSRLSSTKSVHPSGSKRTAIVEPVPVGYGRSLMCWQSLCRTCVRFSFSELCEAPLSATDFAELCRCFEVILLSDVPQLREGSHSKAQRLIWLLDQCYEKHTRLIMTSAAPGPDDLIDLESVSFSGAGGGQSLREVAFAVDRASSRMREMQTM